MQVLKDLKKYVRLTKVAVQSVRVWVLAGETRSPARVETCEVPRPTMKGLSAAAAPGGAPPYCIETGRALLHGVMKHPQVT